LVFTVQESTHFFTAKGKRRFGLMDPTGGGIQAEHMNLDCPVTRQQNQAVSGSSSGSNRQRKRMRDSVENDALQMRHERIRTLSLKLVELAIW